MAEFNHLDARIYVDAPISYEALLQQIAQLLSGTPRKFSVDIACGRVDVRNNDEFNQQSRTEFPDGFLRFPYFLEFYTGSPNSTECRPIVAQALSYLWSKSFSAVAACDYEDELPNRGGFKSHSIPWPKTEALAR